MTDTQENKQVDPKLYVLMKEYDTINSKIEQFLKSQPQMFGAGVIAILGIIGLHAQSETVQPAFIAPNHLLAVLALPFFTTIYANIICYHLMRTITLQGYKRVLEYTINTHLSANITNFSVVGYETEKSNSFKYSLAVGLGLLILFSAIVPIYFVSVNACILKRYDMFTAVIALVSYLILLGFTINSLLQLRTAFKKSFEKSKEQFEKTETELFQ